MNNTLIKLGKDILKKYLEQCTSDEQLMFRRMYCPNELNKDIDKVVDDLDPSKIDHAITQCENTLKKNNRPYIVTIEGVAINYEYNKNYGDDKECVCGHPYYRHFDTYEYMSPIGCKYCGCSYFVEMSTEKRDEKYCERLTSSRYIVIDTYPKCEWEIGDIIETDGDQFWVDELEKFPKIYKKLSWYEKRSENEMPKYVKYILDNNVKELHKVKEWIHGDIYTERKNKEGEITAFIGEHNDYQTSLNGWLPATEKEYLNFIKENDNEK